MKSKRAEEFINGHIKIGNLQFTAADIEYCVMLAEQDAEEQYQDDLHHYQLMMNDTCSEMIDERDEEITRYRKELEESKRREELACKVIDDQRKKIEALKARSVEAYRTHCRRYTNPCIWTTRNKCPDTCAYLQDFIQKLNER